MKSPTSIVNTLLEADDCTDYDPNLDPFVKILLEPYAGYDPSLDPFSDPKNITHDDLGTAYVSRSDIDCSSREFKLMWFRLLYALKIVKKVITLRDELDNVYPEVNAVIDSVDRIYVEASDDYGPGIVSLDVDLLTESAQLRLGPLLGTPVYGSWLVRVVHVDYK